MPQKAFFHISFSSSFTASQRGQNLSAKVPLFLFDCIKIQVHELYGHDENSE